MLELHEITKIFMPVLLVCCDMVAVGAAVYFDKIIEKALLSML